MAWKIKSAKANIQEYHEKEIPYILSLVLSNRGVDASTSYDLLNNPEKFLISPMNLVHINEAVAQIIEAVEKDMEIWIYADYDADGMTSGTIMSGFLKETTNNDVYPFYPNREDGYGLSVAFAEQMVERREEIGKEIFVITVDNGTSCHDAVDFLKANNINVVVTDHHQPKETLPNCTVVNPHIVEDTTYHHLCGAGVAYKVIEAISIIAELPKDYITKYRHLVAIGTVADMMPLTFENMAYIRLGLEQMNGNNKPYPIGLWMKFLGKDKLTPMDIGWEIGPRLNACGRMGASDLGGLLLSADESMEAHEVRDIILEVECINQERKALTDKAKKEIESIDFGHHNVCIFDASAYPAGIAGIIAGKLLEKTNKLSLVYSGKRLLVGSSRAPVGVNIPDIFKEEKRKGNLIDFGGHNEAAGFKLSLEKVYALQDSLNSTMAKVYQELSEMETEEPIYEVDGELTLADVTKENFNFLQSFAYDRNTFKAPMFALKDLEVVSTKRSKNNPNNICFTVNDGTAQKQIWAWGYGEYYSQLGEPQKITMLGQLDLNFMDRKTITVRVDAIEAV